MWVKSSDILKISTTESKEKSYLACTVVWVKKKLDPNNAIFGMSDFFHLSKIILNNSKIRRETTQSLTSHPYTYNVLPLSICQTNTIN